jgi:CRISPR-associated protein Cas6
MVDLTFDLEGGTIPASYRSALWRALQRHAPQLSEEKLVGVLPLRSSANSQGILLSKRAKLIIRMPTELAESAAARITGQNLDIAGSTIRVGSAKSRPIQPYPTIHAQVAGPNDEVLFVEDIRKQMKELGVTGKLICGKSFTINDDQRSIHGYSLVLHDLKPEASLQLQYAGLGDERHFGCGIFVHYKVITGLSED